MSCSVPPFSARFSSPPLPLPPDRKRYGKPYCASPGLYRSREMARLARGVALLLMAGTAAAQSAVSTCSSDSQCRNGGKCADYQDLQLNIFQQCSCANGFTGTYCDVQPQCRDAGVTCFNGGTCPLPGTKRCQNCPTNTATMTGFRCGPHQPCSRSSLLTPCRLF